jgi:hypothetical protein
VYVPVDSGKVRTQAAIGLFECAAGLVDAPNICQCPQLQAYTRGGLGNCCVCLCCCAAVAASVGKEVRQMLDKVSCVSHYVSQQCDGVTL